MASKPNNPPLVVIVGETGSGKSSLALKLARMFNGELISADSWSVYRNFNIGTAKPTSKDRSRIPHHLIDVADAREGFSAVKFKQLANQAIADIAKKGKLPIMVGGTGLYIDSVIFDYSFLPLAPAEERAALNSLSIPELIHKAQDMQLDISDIDLRNKRRIIRLIESRGVRPDRSGLRENTLQIGIKLDNEELRSRVEERTEIMFRQGLVQEVKKLSSLYGWEAEPMKGIGYREFYEYFHGQQTLSETKSKIVSATLNLAKRQRTWFKRNHDIHWISNPEEAVDLITTFLNKSL